MKNHGLRHMLGMSSWLHSVNPEDIKVVAGTMDDSELKEGKVFDSRDCSQAGADVGRYHFTISRSLTVNALCAAWT